MADVDREAWGSISTDRPRAARRSSPRRSSSSPSRGRSAPGTPARSGRRRGPGHMWNWHEGKVALEHLFFTGQVAAARRVNFERLYDTTERVLPAEILERPTPDPGGRAARARPHRRPGARRGHRARPRRLLPAAARRLEGAGRRARRRRRADCRSRSRAGARRRTCGPTPAGRAGSHARALLTPFDSLIWFRQRTERLFDFRYRIEIYTPAAEAHARLLRAAVPARRHARRRASTSSPIASGARCSSRARSPRTASTVTVVAAELAAELRLVATWLDLERVSGARRTATSRASWLRSSADGRAGCQGRRARGRRSGRFDVRVAVRAARRSSAALGLGARRGRARHAVGV